MEVRTKLVLSLVLGLLVTGSGIYLAYSTLSQQSGADQEVDATVLESGVQVTGRYDDEYRVSVEYRYNFDGRTYTSTNVYPGLSGRTFDERSEVEAVIADYPEGATVTAYVDSGNPGESYLIPVDEGSTLLWSGLVVALGVVVTTLFGGSYLYRYLRPGPGDVSPNRAELREQFLAAFREIDDYPVEHYRDVRLSSLDPSREFCSNDFDISVRTLDVVLDSPPETPCENAEELTEYVLGEMDERGYF